MILIYDARKYLHVYQFSIYHELIGLDSRKLINAYAWTSAQISNKSHDLNAAILYTLNIRICLLE
jgi:hypothetical protein